MKVKVDYERCQANGLCTQAAPDVFDMRDDDDQVRLLREDPGEEFRSEVDEAVRICPTGALSIDG